MGLAYYIVDIESTGLKVDFHEINEVSILRVDDQEQRTFHIKVDHPKRASSEALEVQGKTYSDLLKGCPLEDAVKQCHEFILEDGKKPDARCFIAHNAPFDRKFVHSAWKQFGMVFPADLWLCTKQFAQRYVKKYGGEKILEAQKKIAVAGQNITKPKFGLNMLLQGIGIKPKVGAHSAEVDVQNTLDLYAWLMESKTEYLSLIKREPQNKPVGEDLSNDDFE